MGALAVKARSSGSAEKNTYGLPRGEKLRRELQRVFGAQRRAVLRFLKTGRKGSGGTVENRSFAVRWPKPQGDFNGATEPPRNPMISVSRKDDESVVDLPHAWPDWNDFELGALKMSERMTPLIRATWDAAATAFAPRVGLDPDTREVVNPHTERMIEEAALAFCDSTNETTSLSLDEALKKTREELHAGIVEKGESVDKLTKRINAIFDGAEKFRARRIAQTETSRAVHAAQEQAAIASGVVTGWAWLHSSDACPWCLMVSRRAPAVRLGQPFAVIGDNPHYATIKFPPLHPH